MMMSAENTEQNDIELAALEWRIRLKSGSATARDFQAFDAWLERDERHAAAYDEATTLWQALGTLDETALQPQLFRESWRVKARRLFVDLSSSISQRPRRAFIGAGVTVALSVAAISAVVVSPWNAAGPSITAQPVITAYATQRGETKDIVLPDGSKITLGAATQIEFAASADARQVTLLGGAAVFDVESDPDRPFTIAANKFTATVVGTVFDVRSNGGVVRLSIVEGAVDVAHPLMINGAATSIISRKSLVAGEQIIATASEGLASVDAFREADFATWREDRLAYVGATLEELIADANRYSARQIMLEDGLQSTLAERVTFTFDGNDVPRLLSTLPVLFPVAIEDRGAGPILVRSAQTTAN